MRRHNIVVLTGPKHGRQGTYLRQAALIANHGADGIVRSPARAVRLGIVDRVFTRNWRERQPGPGTLDIHVEMTETAAISAHPRRPRVADPVGRSRTRYVHLRRTGDRLGRPSSICMRECEPRLLFATPLFRADRVSRAIEWSEELSRIRKRNRRKRSFFSAASNRERPTAATESKSQSCGVTERSRGACARSAGRA